MSGALAGGNAMIAKPAEQTSLIAARAVELSHEADVPKDALILVQGDGATIGLVLTRSAALGGMVFTGSTETAQIIDRNIAKLAMRPPFWWLKREVSMR